MIIMGLASSCIVYVKMGMKAFWKIEKCDSSRVGGDNENEKLDKTQTRGSTITRKRTRDKREETSTPRSLIWKWESRENVLLHVSKLFFFRSLSYLPYFLILSASPSCS